METTIRTLSEVSPFYSTVPKGLSGNISFRQSVLEQARTDLGFRQTLWSMCRRDILFWINTFVVAYDPRNSDRPLMPFVTWPAQDSWLLGIQSALGKRDIKSKKPRDMGLSWLALLSVCHAWQFGDFPVSFLFVSRKEELVDSEKTDSLFWKLDQILGRQPGWLLPDYFRKFKHFRNRHNGATIDGEATTTDFAVGGRRTALIVDEAGKIRDLYAMRDVIRDVSNSIFWISSPYPEGVAFQEIWDADDGAYRIEPRWWDDPRRTVGMVVGPDGVRTSPWLERQRKVRHPRDFQTNVLGEFYGGGTGYYGPELQERIKDRGDLMPPFVRSSYVHDGDQGGSFVPSSSGHYLLWCLLDGAGEPAQDRNYALSADIAQGTGASNSVLAVVDQRTREKVLEFANPNVNPRLLAELAVSLCRTFNNAYLIWESNGPGRDFGNKVEELGYANFYMRRREGTRGRPATKIPGWNSDKSSREPLLGAHAEALWKGDFIDRSQDSFDELKCYIYNDSGDVVHAKSMNQIDPSGARDRHGDRVVASALLVHALKECGRESEERKMVLPVNSVGRRREMRRHDRYDKWVA